VLQFSLAKKKIEKWSHCNFPFWVASNTDGSYTDRVGPLQFSSATVTWTTLQIFAVNEMTSRGSCAPPATRTGRRRSPQFAAIYLLSYLLTYSRQQIRARLTVEVDFVDYSEQFGFGRIFAERPKYLSELLGCNDAVAVLVERRERLAKLCTQPTQPLPDVTLSTMATWRYQYYCCRRRRCCCCS